MRRILQLGALALALVFSSIAALLAGDPNQYPGMHRVRMAARENRLTSTVITEESYVPAIEDTGRGWVVEDQASVIAFAIGNALTGNIWALFVDPEHEGRGHGRRLHDAMVE